MWLQSILVSGKSHSRRARKASRVPRLLVEELESRTLPSFFAPVSYPVGAYPEAVAVGDFTGSGIPDLVVANHQSSNVSVLLGKGDGTFGPAQDIAVGGAPVAVAVGDFNNDGKLDIVTANDSNSTVSVLLGNGNGTFQPPLNYVLPAQAAGAQTPLSVAVGDFNKDGKLDLAVTADTYYSGTPGHWEPWNYGEYYVPPIPPQRDAYVNVLIGNGAGGFSADNSYALPDTSPLYAGSRSIAVGDFNGDGQLDLAIADISGSTVDVLPGIGDGTFASPTTFNTGPHPLSVAVGDFNGDKKLDLVTANRDGNSVSLLLGAGDGTFPSAVNYSVGDTPTSVLVADFNRDGRQDIVAANFVGNSLSVLLGNGDGTFQTAQNFAVASPVAMAVGDFNRDGWPDLAVVNPWANTVSVLLNAADWPASQASSFVVNGFPSPITAGTPGSFTITAKTAAGATDPYYAGTVHFTSSDPKAALPADYTFTAADAGVHTLSATLKTAGTQSLTATDSSTAITGTDTGIAVNIGPLAGFTVTSVTSTMVHSPSSVLETVHAVDASGNLITSYSGPPSVTATISPTSSSSDFPMTVPISSSGLGLFLATIPATGSYTVSVAAGAYAGTATSPLVVLPGTPIKLAFLAQPTNTPAGDTLAPVTVEILDSAGNLVTSDNSDVVQLSVGSGPGSLDSSSMLTATAVNGIAVFNNVKGNVLGAYTLSAVCSTLGAISTSAPFTITSVTISSFTSMGCGFAVQFNAPILVNSTTPVLYGTGFPGPIPSVTLTGPHGSVEGSAVVNTTANTLTFVATNTASQGNFGTPLLPDGIYTAVVHGTALDDGIQAIGDSYLGADYPFTFTVSNGAADVVWTPATANGPLQPLEAPGNNLSGDGYPVYLNDQTGAVTSVLVTFQYNPSMLTVTGVRPNPSLPGSTFTIVTSGSNFVVLKYTGPLADGSRLTGGQVPLGFLSATVPNSSASVPIYRGKDLLQTTAVSVNSGAIRAVGDEALHLVAYVGDANGDGAYSSDDAVKITRTALQQDSGFAAYPLVDPVIVADTDGSGFIPADAALQINEVSVGYPAANVPPPPVGANTTPHPNNVAPAMERATRGTAPAYQSSSRLWSSSPRKPTIRTWREMIESRLSLELMV